ncbi:MAG: DUF2141 domain-containing protein [Flavobacteriaceae bacterium]|nr:DUF2141 domain-containing protein [Flavobacteriaceae bacterium]
MGGARFFGQDLTPYCKRLQESITLYETFEAKGRFHPRWGKEWTLQVIKSCSGTEDGKHPSVHIEAVVTNVLKKGGEVIFALYDSESNFLMRKPIATKKVEPADSEASVIFENITPGTYALVALHDMNGNEQMDFDNGMPKEDYGSSNNVMRMGPPNFNDSKFTITNKSVTLEIRF